MSYQANGARRISKQLEADGEIATPSWNTWRVIAAKWRAGHLAGLETDQRWAELIAQSGSGPGAKLAHASAKPVSVRLSTANWIPQLKSLSLQPRLANGNVKWWLDTIILSIQWQPSKIARIKWALASSDGTSRMSSLPALLAQRLAEEIVAIRREWSTPNQMAHPACQARAAEDDRVQARPYSERRSYNLHSKSNVLLRDREASRRRFVVAYKKASRIMIGIGTPSSQRRIERPIMLPFKLDWWF
jgi:hypothetical protein